MEHRPVLEMLCVRHGKTNYTGIFPDLTADGEAHVREVARGAVSSWVKEHAIDIAKLEIVSSPAPRAHGTAAVIAEVLGCLDEHIVIRESLGALKWRNPERALLACRGLRGKGYIDYETEPIFADATIFETPSEVRMRWHRFFSDYIATTRRIGVSRQVIVVSHYELLCNITRDFFDVTASEATALRYAEPIALSVDLEGTDNFLYGSFRGKEIHLSLLEVCGKILSC